MNHKERAERLVASMSLAEKADLCSGFDLWNTKPNERLALPAIMLTDGPHGLRKQDVGAEAGALSQSVPATCFPTAAALACTWDVDLLREIGEALGNECAANDVAVLLGPGVNIKRHPLGGRNFEYFSEDPLLSGELAAALVQGIQERGVGACLKHFAANDQETTRTVVDAIVDERTLREIHLRGFEIAVRKAAPWMVMGAYNRLNGAYCCENEWLLTKVLRQEWGFEGAVVTDWGATNDRVRGIEAGLDLEMPGSAGVNDRRVAQAVEAGTLDQEALDRCVARVVELVLKSADRKQVAGVDAEAHHELARRAAAEATVLLKNDDALLPLEPSCRVAVIGAFAKTPRYQGTGSSRVTPTRLDCAFDAIQAVVDACIYAPGYDADESEPDAAKIDEAVRAAKDADVAIVFAGLPAVAESEGFDRASLALPPQHDRLIEASCAANPNTVVVLAGGAPVQMPWVDTAKAIVECYLGGQAGGSATADVLFGRCNPSGKLAETFAVHQADIGADEWFPGTGRQVQYREGLHVGYRHFDTFRQPSSCEATADAPARARVLFPFGHGLSYTEFGYDGLEVSLCAAPLEAQVSFTLANVGDVGGAEVAQLYVHKAGPGGHRPEQELRAFRKVRLAAGERERVTLDLDESAFAHFSPSVGGWVVESGEYEIRVGSSSRDIRLRQRIVVAGTPGQSEQGRAEGVEPDTRAQGANRLEVDDNTFAAMLGRPIPPPDLARPFHLNSTFAEISTTWLGRKVADGAKAEFAKRLGDDLDPATQRMIDAMATDTPLRIMVLFSEGALTFHLLEALIAVLNRRYFKALKALVSHLAEGKRTP